MKLATLKEGSRDGRLAIVSRDLTRWTDAGFLAPTLQAALDDWRRIAPHLASLAQSLEVGAVPSQRFHEHDAHSPLTRAYQHVGCGDAFVAPRDGIAAASGITISPAIAVLTGDVARQTGPADCRDAIVLLMLAALAVETVGDAGTATFSPVAVTPDELGEAWDGNVARPLHVAVNGKPLETEAARHNLSDLVCAAARTRALMAGAIVVSASGPPSVLKQGDTIRIEMKDRAGHSIFGAIEQQVSTAVSP